MRSFGSTPGSGGIAAIVAGTLIVGCLMSCVTGSYGHWPPLLLGIVVGLMAVASINR